MRSSFAGLALIMLLIPSQLVAQDLTGIWDGSDGSTYYVRQVGAEVFWHGHDRDGGAQWTNAFFGRVAGSQVMGSWADVPRGRLRNSGTLVLRIESPNRLSAMELSGFPYDKTWTRRGTPSTGEPTGGDSGGEGGPDLPVPTTIDWTMKGSSLTRPERGTLRLSCAPNPSGRLARVGGTDVYWDGSSVCAAAVHAGVIDRSTGGVFAVEVLGAARRTYRPSTRNDVKSTSVNLGGNPSGAFRFPPPGDRRYCTDPDGNVIYCEAAGSTGRPPVITATADMSEWTVDHGSFKAGRVEVTASPAGDGRTSYYVAPASHHGDWRGRRALRFEKKSWGGTYYGANQHGATGDVILKNGDQTARADIERDHSRTWQPYSIPLQPSAWKLSGGANRLEDVLRNVTAVRIRAEYGAGTDHSALRNVTVE